MDRNTKGVIGFAALSVIFLTIFSFIFHNIIAVLLALAITLLGMVGREIYQWKHYNLESFEWDDVMRYSITILFSTIGFSFIYVLIGLIS